MYVKKYKSSGVQTERTKPLLESFALLFYLCKALGLHSQDWDEFRRYKHLKKSTAGDLLVVFGIIITCINFNCMIFAFPSQSYIAEKNPLSIGIGFVLTYFSLALYISDRINALLKQHPVAKIFQELHKIDQDFRDLNIVLNNNYIKYRLVAGIVMVTFIESTSFIIIFILLIDKINWTAWLWLYNCIPTYFNSLDKLWYMGVLIAIRKRFERLNAALDLEALTMEQERLKQKKLKVANNLNNRKQRKKCAFKNQIRPETKNFQTVFGDVVHNSPLHASLFEANIYAPSYFRNHSSDSSTTTDNIYPTLEDKFAKYCQLHDTLCNVAKQLNQVYAFPTLMLMGYCFCIIIAKLYYFYTASVDQAIPPMFQVTQNWWITAMYITYIFAKCVSIFHGNWLTSLEAKKTGICIHRYAMAVDKNEIYEMINHLSLKLFNHSCNFNACGYFSLNMTTLLSFCGGITTYLIILIQFNLEEQQLKINTANDQPTAITPNNNFAVYHDVVNDTWSRNTTSSLSLFDQINNV